jgi:signal transduction histidine kinase
MAWGERSDTALRRWAMAAFAFVCLVSVTSPFLARGVGGHAPLADPGKPVIDWGDPFFCGLMAGSGLLILWYRPRHAVGWVLIATGMAEALCTFGQTYGERGFVYPDEGLPLRTVALQLSAPLWLVAVFLPATSMLLRYPSGHVDGKWARRVERAVLIGLAVLYVGYAGGDHAVTDEIDGHLPVVRLPEVLGGILMAAGALMIVPGAVFTLLHTVRRTWRASYPERQQLAWLLTFVPAAVVLLFTPWEWTQRLFWGIPVAVVIGVLRYGLAGIEVVVRRTLLYGTLTGLHLLVFVAITASLSSVSSGGLPTVLAAGLVAVGVVPLRDRLQRVVDRFVYGDRGDPLAALTRLGTPLGLTTDDALLPEVLSAITSSVRVPGAEIVGEGGTHATVGLVGDDVVEVPLVMGGAAVGVLRVAPRAGEKELPAADRRLVEGLAPLVAAVLHAVELADALRVEQARVVAATETERARLRQELHDGLGPSLTGIGLGLEALESRVGESDLVTRLRDETASSLDEVRRIIDGLRPGALETADLLSLLRIRAHHLSSTTPLRVEVVAPARLPVLPHAVEGAALRIVDEALTNVVRHAAATTCTVTVSLDDALHLEVRDDGRGYDGPRPGGVGVGSMRGRAEQLGGSCDVVATGSGTAVTVELPLVSAGTPATARIS